MSPQNVKFIAWQTPNVGVCAMLIHTFTTKHNITTFRNLHVLLETKIHKISVSKTPLGASNVYPRK